MKLLTPLKLLGLGFLILALAGAVPASLHAAEPAKMQITAVGAGLGGIWTVGLGNIGKMFTQKFPGSEFKLVPGASMANSSRLDNREADLSVTHGSMAAAAYAGRDPYKKKITNALGLANLHNTARLHIIVPENSPLQSLADIKRMKYPLRMAHGPMGATTELTIRWALEEEGITYKDIRAWGGKTHPLSYNDAVNMFKDGHLDMFCYFGAGEPSYLQEINASMRFRWVPLSEKTLQAVHEKRGIIPSVVPKGFLGGKVTEEIPCISDTDQLIVRGDLDEQIVYELAKIVITGREEIVRALPGWNTLDPKIAPHGNGFPLHPGAIRYYKEAGLLD